MAARLKDSSYVGVLKAGIMLSFERNPKRDQMGCSILAVAACAPELLDPVKDAHREHLKLIAKSGLKFERAALLALASDGFMFNNLLGLNFFSKSQSMKIQREMLRMVDEAAGRS
jgi:hypothetical protein